MRSIERVFHQYSESQSRRVKDFVPRGRTLTTLKKGSSSISVKGIARKRD